MSYFSVIIPTYNRSDRIKSAIQSVLDQNFEDWELIVVDDGSTDGTKTVVDDIHDSRIKYHYQENAERGAARNKGVSLATGKYVFFLDSDDYIYPEHLKHASEQLKELKEPEFFHIRYEEVSPGGKKQVPSLNRQTVYRKTIRQNQFACQFFLRKDIAEEFPFCEDRNLKIGEDWEVILKIAVRYQLNFSNRVLAAIVQHEDRTMEVASPDVITTSRDIMIKRLSGDRMISSEILSNVFTELTSLASLAHALRGEKGKAFRLWNRSVLKKGRILFTRRSMAIYKKIIFGGKA